MAKKAKAKKAAVKKMVSKKTTQKSVKKSSLKKTAVKAAKSSVKVKKVIKKSKTKVIAKTKKSTTLQKKQSNSIPLLNVGDVAPDFNLQNELGESIQLSGLKGSKVVLYFYPKDDTPGCTQESCDFRDSFSRVKALGVHVFGISKDSVASHLKFKTKYSLPFSLLSDESGTVCEAYGAWKEKSMYGRKYMGIERSTFVIDEAGKVSHYFPKVSVKGHVDEVLTALGESA